MGPFRIVRWEFEWIYGGPPLGRWSPWVRMTGQWGLGLPVVGNSWSRPRRRSPPGTPPGAYGSDVEALKSLLAAISASRSIRLSVPHGRWALLCLASATMAGSGSKSGNRSTAMTRKQESQRISTMPSREETWLRPRSGTTGKRLLHGGSSRVSRGRLPLFSNYCPPLTCMPKSAARLASR